MRMHERSKGLLGAPTLEEQIVQCVILHGVPKHKASEPEQYLSREKCSIYPKTTDEDVCQ